MSAAVVLGALFVDMDNVRARYECVRPGCTHRLEGPVYGADEVKSFVDNIRTVHRARCTASASQQGERR
ncbi:hypothetical protein [Streptomyces sp. NPDC047079]|uniref:hypothetical protein n=1 Tax=Streptomyces sp. NPDC047079 TaxID=3154607 RepID=UPI0033F547E8